MKVGVKTSKTAGESEPCCPFFHTEDGTVGLLLLKLSIILQLYQYHDIRPTFLPGCIMTSLWLLYDLAIDKQQDGKGQHNHLQNTRPNQNKIMIT